MNVRALRGYALWFSIFTIAIVATYAVGFRAGSDARRNVDYDFAERLDSVAHCVADAKSGAATSMQPMHGFSTLAYSRVMGALLAEQDCLGRQSMPRFSAADLYDIGGVALRAEFPGPDDPTWRHPGVPRKHLGSVPIDGRSWATWVNAR